MDERTSESKKSTPCAEPTPTKTPTPTQTSQPQKVLVQFRHAGDAPILRQTKFTVSSELDVAATLALLRMLLHMPNDKALHLYVNSAFAPPHDQLLGDLAQCFAIDGTLTLNYCTTPAWG